MFLFIEHVAKKWPPLYIFRRTLKTSLVVYEILVTTVKLKIQYSSQIALTCIFQIQNVNAIFFKEISYRESFRLNGSCVIVRPIRITVVSRRSRPSIKGSEDQREHFASSSLKVLHIVRNYVFRTPIVTLKYSNFFF